MAYKLNDDELKAKKSFERALKKLDDCGICFMSVCSGTSSSLKLVPAEAYSDYVAATGNHGVECQIISKCPTIKDSGTWEGEIVP